jgi:alkylation response protein AidB-like acyl-CoA dehydrogenase
MSSRTKFELYCFQGFYDELILNSSAQFLLTEQAHGLDAPNLETTATLQPDGSFLLNTPHPGAAKYMPPTTPLAGMAKVAIVIARLMVNGEDRGVRPFIVTLGDDKQMAKGVTCKYVQKVYPHAVIFCFLLRYRF